MSSTISLSDGPIKGLALASTIWLASAMTATTAVFIPSLLRPVSPSVTRSHKADNASGRLTPQLETNTVDPLSAPGVTSTNAHRHAAQQFARFDALAFRTQVPLELLLIVTYGYLAYASTRGSSPMSVIRSPYALSAGLFTAVFPFTGALMVPYVHKILRIAGDEDKIEPYEDAPPDREADARNVVEFLSKWNMLNAVRAGMVVTAAGISGWAWVENM